MPTLTGVAGSKITSKLVNQNQPLTSEASSIATGALDLFQKVLAQRLTQVKRRSLKLPNWHWTRRPVF